MKAEALTLISNIILSAKKGDSNASKVYLNELKSVTPDYQSFTPVLKRIIVSEIHRERKHNGKSLNKKEEALYLIFDRLFADELNRHRHDKEMEHIYNLLKNFWKENDSKNEVLLEEINHLVEKIKELQKKAVKEKVEKTNIDIPMYLFKFKQRNYNDKISIILAPILSILGIVIIYITNSNQLLIPIVITVGIIIGYLKVTIKYINSRKRLNELSLAGFFNFTSNNSD